MSDYNYSHELGMAGTEIWANTQYDLSLQDLNNVVTKINNNNSYNSALAQADANIANRDTSRDNSTSDIVISMADYVLSTGERVTVVGTAGNDDFGNRGTGARIACNAGNDHITNTENYCSISGGAGDDTIESTGFYSVGVTINGGTGNDSIKLNSDKKNNVIQYSPGDGYDTVEGWNNENTLQIAGGDYTRSTVGSDIIIQVGSGSITFQGVVYQYGSEKTINIESVPVGSFGVEDISYTAPTTPAATATTSTPIVSSSYVYAGGDQVISNYAGEQIMLGTAPTGAFFGGGNFALTSATGTLFIQNANDKLISFTDGAGNPYAKAYAATAAGVIDGRGLAGYEVITGSDWGGDVIYAGDGSSQLWGGNGSGADVLTGGGGADIFVGGKTQGSDVFFNASSADVVNLNDATLSDIVAAAESNGVIALAFNTGNVIAVQSSEALSSAFVLADGSAYRFNHATKSWQGA